MKNCKYAESEFSTDFFKYDASKYRTDTAQPFSTTSKCWKSPCFEEIDILDNMLRHMGEIDFGLWANFHEAVMEELLPLHEAYETGLQKVVERMTRTFVDNEGFVKQWVTDHPAQSEDDRRISEKARAIDFWRISEGFPPLKKN